MIIELFLSTPFVRLKDGGFVLFLLEKKKELI